MTSVIKVCFFEQKTHIVNMSAPPNIRNGRPQAPNSDSLISDIRREEIEDNKARKASRRLEREFGKTIRLARAIAPQNQHVASQSFCEATKSRLRSGAVYRNAFKLPVVVGIRRRTMDGRTSFTCKIIAIPKSVLKRTLRDGTKIGPGAAGEGVRYAVGDRSTYLIGDRTQLGSEGKTLIESNIDDDPEKCFEFFDLIEKEERKPSPDQLTVDFGKRRLLWRIVVGHPACDPALIAAYRQNPNGKAVVELCRGASALREVIRDCDVRPQLKPKQQAARDKADGFTFKLGRGGRTQWRVMVSFPVEFTAGQRKEALQEICAYFASKGCMYLGVIHEPSAANDARNFHCHIDIYDRPCRRLSGDEKLDLANVPKKWLGAVTTAYRRGDFEKDIGRWDFEVVRIVKYGSGNKRAQKVFRANKSATMREYGMPADTRERVAGIINRIAMRDLGRELFDHRTNVQMGIDKEPDQPLGPNAHALEGKGFATNRGLQNEKLHAEANRREIERRYHERCAELDQLSLGLLRGTTDYRRADLRFNERDAAHTALANSRDAALLKRDAALLQLEVNRHLSSAYQVIKTSNRVILKGEDKGCAHAERRQAARDYWRAWVADHADDVRCLRETNAMLRDLDNDSTLHVLIGRAVAPATAEEAAFLDDETPRLPILPTRRMTSLLLESVDDDAVLMRAASDCDVSPAVVIDSAEQLTTSPPVDRHSLEVFAETALPDFHEGLDDCSPLQSVNDDEIDEHKSRSPRGSEVMPTRPATANAEPTTALGTEESALKELRQNIVNVQVHDKAWPHFAGETVGVSLTSNDERREASPLVEPDHALIDKPIVASELTEKMTSLGLQEDRLLASGALSGIDLTLTPEVQAARIASLKDRMAKISEKMAEHRAHHFVAGEAAKLLAVSDGVKTDDEFAFKGAPTRPIGNEMTNTLSAKIARHALPLPIVPPRPPIPNSTYAIELLNSKDQFDHRSRVDIDQHPSEKVEDFQVSRLAVPWSGDSTRMTQFRASEPGAVNTDPSSMTKDSDLGVHQVASTNATSNGLQDHGPHRPEFNADERREFKPSVVPPLHASHEQVRINPVSSLEVDELSRASSATRRELSENDDPLQRTMLSAAAGMIPPPIAVVETVEADDSELASDLVASTSHELLVGKDTSSGSPVGRLAPINAAASPMGMDIRIHSPENALPASQSLNEVASDCAHAYPRPSIASNAKSVISIPRRQMFAYIQEQGWTLTIQSDGPLGEEAIVFAEPNEVPPPFIDWLEEHQNFAPWFYRFQQESVLPIPKAGKEVMRSATLAAAYNQAAVMAARRGNGVI